ncbi:LicD family-domain-containing protein [Whalleya microplaca]|nr:LicD family-domain-containing protein [Whalleya microplaca]
MHTLRLLLLAVLTTLAFASTTTAIDDQLSPRDPYPDPEPEPAPDPKSHKKPSEKPKETKYFHEPGTTLELGHYDARYFNGTIAYAEHRAALRHLIRAYLSTFRALGVETWLAHGSLLGWWWNGRIMPWDYDLDVQVTAATMARLALYFNGTLHEYHVPGNKYAGGETPSSDEGSGEGDGGKEKEEVHRTYLLDINPHHADLGRGNGANIIDARWIDVSNGMYIDITALAERDPVASPGVWSCKNEHKYRTTELYPMRRSEFEGVPATVPYAFDKILSDEYGPKSLTTTEWAGHRWEPELKEWVMVPGSPHRQEHIVEQEDGTVVVVVEEIIVTGGGPMPESSETPEHQ